VARRTARTVGSDAEQQALQYLLRQGLALVRQNFRTRRGEIDLILRDGNCLVFVEVRYRAANQFSRAGLTVDIHKQRKLIRTAAVFLAKQGQFTNSVCRFDVVAIDADKQGKQSIEWIKDAFTPADSSL
jgi:putative endonuclease